jgi:hypothetical protein
MSYYSTGGLISPKKTYAISRFLANIFPVPISPNFFEIYISNYFVCVMNDVISRIKFPKATLINFCLIAFGEVLNFTHFWWFALFKFIVKILIKLKKLFDIWRHFECLRVFHFWTKTFFFISYRRMCQYRRFFGDIGPPLYNNKIKFHKINEFSWIHEYCIWLWIICVYNWR